MGYVGVVVLGFLAPWQPRLFWTILLPLLPVAVVLMGYANWRQVCPLAWFGDIGRALNRGTQRRVPEVLERSFFVVMFGVLLAGLAFRLLATNGDAVWLSGWLVGLALSAALVNLWFTGKTWCNFFCPVGVVERIYTEPNSLRAAGNSQCVRCSACKKNCPDIDQENAFWRDLTSRQRRIATYSFPGLVLAFYTYYWLRAGDWEAYFAGRWTLAPVDADLVTGAGFFFAPRVPALLAAPLTLLVFSAVSYGAFCVLEKLVSRRLPQLERRRHVMLALAAFAAFSSFYFFAGAPSLRRISGGARIVAFLAPALATIVLAKRWRRTREHFIGERGATRLLRNWPFDKPPPEDPREVYAWIKAGEHARDQHLAAYESTVREMIADGLVTAGELRLLEGVRQQLGIGEREHERMLERLSAEERELFSRESGRGIEERAQLRGYEVALTEALLRHAPADEIDALRREFGVDDDAHKALMTGIRGRAGGLLTRANAQLARAREIQADLVTLRTHVTPDDAVDFLASLLLRARDGAVARVLELLEVAGKEVDIPAPRTELDLDDGEARRDGLQWLVAQSPEIAAFASELEPLLEAPTGLAGEVADIEIAVQQLERLAVGADPYQRAAAVWAAGNVLGERARPLLDRAAEDSSELVRETADHAGRRAGRPTDGGAPIATLEGGLSGLSTIEADAVPAAGAPVRRARPRGPARARLSYRGRDVRRRRDRVSRGR